MLVKAPEGQDSEGQAASDAWLCQVHRGHRPPWELPLSRSARRRSVGLRVRLLSGEGSLYLTALWQSKSGPAISNTHIHQLQLSHLIETSWANGVTTGFLLYKGQALWGQEAELSSENRSQAGRGGSQGKSEESLIPSNSEGEGVLRDSCGKRRYTMEIFQRAALSAGEESYLKWVLKGETDWKAFRPPIPITTKTKHTKSCSIIVVAILMWPFTWWVETKHLLEIRHCRGNWNYIS